MKVHVRYFAIVRDRLKLGHEIFDLAESSNLSDLLDLIRSKHPEIVDQLKSIKVSVNLEFAEKDVKLSDGDEIALIPPVSGG